ncbi:MAG TPA: oxidoreductase [Solirubrobacterales bacterium]|nr:oxidoreductase [Solirubrobacterales bacterium]
MAEKWTAEQMPSQAGRTAVVTGANSGLGLATARGLAAAGAQVVLACRDTAKGEAAAAEIRDRTPGASVIVEPLDLASLESVRACAERLVSGCESLDLLINNAGVMAPGQRRETADGFEMQIGTNHLGHFALTLLLLPRMEGRKGARVVTVTSTAHKIGRIRFDDLQSQRSYGRWRCYCQSKLANVLFARGLDRRLRERGSVIASLAAHPGYAATNLQTAAPPAFDRAVFALSNRLLAQSAEMGALPQLYAATRPHVEGGLFIGPDGFEEQRGHPKVTQPVKRGRDPGTAARLWTVSEELTEVAFSAS